MTVKVDQSKLCRAGWQAVDPRKELTVQLSPKAIWKSIPASRGTLVFFFLRPSTD